MLGRSLVGVFLVLLGVWYLDANAAPKRQTDRSIKPQMFTAKDYGSDSIVSGILLARVIEDKTNPNIPDFEALYRMKLRVGDEYGWFAILNRNVDTVKVDQTLTVAKKPKSWGHVDPKDISPDGRTVRITEFKEVINAAPGEAIVYQAWEIMDGDPEGPAEIIVRIDDREVARFFIEFYK